MKQLLLPVIRLMNRMPYLYKFILISLTFIIPLIILAALQISLLQSKKAITERKLEGLQSLQQLTDLNINLTHYRDFRFLSGFINEAEKKQTDQRLNLLRSEVDSLINELDNRGFAFDDSGQLTAEFDRFKKRWREIDSSNFSDLQGLMEERFSHFNQLTDNGWRLAMLTAFLSGLSQDSDRVNYGAMRLVLDHIPSISVHLGQSRVFGGYALHSKRITSTLVEQLNRIHGNLLTDQVQLTQTAAFLIEGNNQVTPSLSLASSNATKQLSIAAARLDEEIILGDRMEQPWQEFVKNNEKDLATSWTLTDEALNQVHNNLEHRLGEQQTRLITLLTALAFVALLSGYFYLGFNLSVRENINNVLAAARRLAQGDLTGKVEIDAKDEMGALIQEFNEMTNRIHLVIGQVKGTAHEVASQSDALDQTATNSSTAARQQKEQTVQIVQAITNMTECANEVSQTILTASNSARDAYSTANDGHELVCTTLGNIQQLASNIDNSVEVINRLARESDNISQVLDVIKGIAEQTNLLALNAAIEAARAGEMGRGFAVVADEVRNLAQRTHSSTEEIERMITQFQSGVSEAVQFMDISHEKARTTVEESARVGTALEEITRATSNIVEMSTQVAASSEQQAQVAQEVNRSINEISEASQLTAEGADTTAQSCNKMSQLSTQLQDLVASFKV